MKCTHCRLADYDSRTGECPVCGEVYEEFFIKEPMEINDETSGQN